MKVYLTAPYDPNGIEEIKLDQPPVGDTLIYDNGCTVSYGWFREGETWHRTRKAAVKAAKQFRQQWIVETTKKAAEIISLPPIS